MKSGLNGIYEVDIQGTAFIGIEDELNNFNKIKVTSNQEGDEIPDLVASSVGLCGSLKMFDENL